VGTLAKIQIIGRCESMFFKPRIFISSTFDLIPLRGKIDNIFGKTGAEVLLYEKNLTPSTQSATYRRDIQEADFVIMILDSRYGSTTEDAGLSGTHEEWRLATRFNIPCHVYIKSDVDREENLDEFIKELNKERISYFYFKTENELLKRLKETTFTIAHEIAFKNLKESELGEKAAKKLIQKYEYKIALEFIKLIESVIHISKQGSYDFLNSTLITEAFSYLSYKYDHNKTLFYDTRLNEKFEHMILLYNGFSFDHSNVYSSRGNLIEVYLKFMDKTTQISRLSYNGDGSDLPVLKEKVEQILNAFEDFKTYVTNRKVEIDIL